MSATDQIIDVAVLGFTIGVASKSFNLVSKPIKKGKHKSKCIWG